MRGISRKRERTDKKEGGLTCVAKRYLGKSPNGATGLSPYIPQVGLIRIQMHRPPHDWLVRRPCASRRRPGAPATTTTRDGIVSQGERDPSSRFVTRTLANRREQKGKKSPLNSPTTIRSSTARRIASSTCRLNSY